MVGENDGKVDEEVVKVEPWCEVLVEVLLSQVNELRKDQVAGASQAQIKMPRVKKPARAMSGEPAVRLLRINVR